MNRIRSLIIALAACLGTAACVPLLPPPPPPLPLPPPRLLLLPPPPHAMGTGEPAVLQLAAG